MLGLLGLLAGCLGGSDRKTLSELRNVEPDLTEVRVDRGIEQAMMGYQKFLEDAPKSTLTPEAMRRLADLKLEKEFGVLGRSDASALPAPEKTASVHEEAPTAPAPASLADASRALESQQELERRATGDGSLAYTHSGEDLELPGGRSDSSGGPLEAIALYDEILATYPDYPNNDQVLYQKARAFDELGRNDEAIQVTDVLVAKYPRSSHIDEVQFRRGEYFFTRKKYLDAEEAYGAVVNLGAQSEYYELALYKLGWTLYKEMMLEEALEQYITLLDYKVSVGYDFDQTEDEADRSRIDDTYRVISLCFSDLGGTQSVADFFRNIGERSYEYRVYRQLGEFYLEKLRYADAASVYEAFVDLYPYHEVSPHFGMRVVEIYEAGGFPKLVVEAKKAFAANYGLQSEYWSHFDIHDSPEVLAYVKSNLKDLANHYHALYQNDERPEDKPDHFAEATHWYRAYLDSFAADPEAPAIHYQLADLYLENKNFDVAAQEYEHVAYDYPEHPKSSAAGYASIFAHREELKSAPEEQKQAVRLETIASSLRFVDRFPKHEHAAAVLGAATDDLYALEDYENAILNGRRLIDEYPDADFAIRRTAWTVVAHSSFALLDFEGAETAYSRVIEMTTTDEKSYQGLVDNLAASIYKQGEKAEKAGDHRAAADHYLRIAKLAPTSAIRPIAEYDAGTALIQLEDWTEAASVFESFRSNFPNHELNHEATRQIAFVYRKAGNPSRAAEEYERVAANAEEPDMRREALLVAGDLYGEAELPDRALRVYGEYVKAFPLPIEAAVVTRFKMAEIHQKRGEQDDQDAQLKRIIEIDSSAGDDRSDTVRVTAARSALILTERLVHRFDEVELKQPFEKNLQEKQHRMDVALEGLDHLVDYEVGEVTAAATFYMAEIFADFSRSLQESERPDGLSASELQDYEMALEEEAYPFEERAIEVHEKNLELMRAGVFNEWIEKSLAQLAVMMPGRYAKFEESSGVIESIDTYVYRVPSSLLAPEAEETAVAGTSGESEETVVTAAPVEESAAEESPTESPADETPLAPQEPVPAAPASLDPAASSALEATPGAETTNQEEMGHAAID
jgi:TolA-binding protein